MVNYIFPIFAFGLVMTGIVFLGLQQASDLAKSLAAERSDDESGFKNPGPISPHPNGAPAQVPTNRS